MSTMRNRLRRAVLSIVASTGVSISGAIAAGTDAGTAVSNTFTLDYQVGGVSQTQISNSGTPTVFTVDRLVDVTVTSAGDVNVSPNATGQQLVFSVRNDGNDNQAYSLALEDLAGDDFDATLGANATIYVDDGNGTFEPGGADGAGASYVLGGGSASADIAPDAVLWVVVTGDIGGATNGQSDGVVLIADSLDPVSSLDPAYTGATAGSATTAAAGANTQTGAAQNVLADLDGPAAADGALDGAHSAIANFNVVAADVTASKSVSVIASDGSAINCATDPVVAGNQYAVPGACIEYVISATNDALASATATGIDISDTLPDEVAFVGAVQSGFATAGTLTPPGGGCASSCVVSLTGASLDPGDTGTVTIRATVR